MTNRSSKIIIGQGPSERRVHVPTNLTPADLQRQMFEPVAIAEMDGLWVYRSKVVRVSDAASVPPDEVLLRIKHRVLADEKALDKLRRQVEAFERFEKSSGTPRTPIPDEVRMFVWQRDSGKCVRCGGNELLEFDHIIPLAKGGSNTERNIQLLCETCNRSKGAEIV